MLENIPLGLLNSDGSIPDILLHSPGTQHHAYAKGRSHSLGISPRRGIRRAIVSVKPYQHYAIHLAFGNGTPEEITLWLKKGYVDLRSFPCQVLFGKNATIKSAIRTFRAKYSATIKDAQLKVFLENPYQFETRWHSGTTAKITDQHLDNLRILLDYYSIPEIPEPREILITRPLVLINAST